ncbi:NmrA family NAD(P)-binding protein [Nocardia fluminea]|uniref:NAD-dependent epimerase/dehydratase family protein n=1 Tax=Nocardia fluminea TaxID=134984 RepID=UPI003D141D06
MILITGATGTIGSDIVRQLAAEGLAVRAATRDPERTGFPAGVEPLRAGHPVPNLTGDGRQPVVDPRDVAAVAVTALRSPAHAGRILTLTGPELMSGHEQAAVLAEILGRPIEVTDIPEGDTRAFMIAAGLPPAFVEGAAVGQSFVRHGHNETITDDIEQALGRPSRSYAAWVADHRAAFAPVVAGVTSGPN